MNVMLHKRVFSVILGRFRTILDVTGHYEICSMRHFIFLEILKSFLVYFGLVFSHRLGSASVDRSSESKQIQTFFM